MSSLEQALRQGSRAVIACQIASQLIALGVLAVLYRELGLEPYGFLGMVMPLLLLVRIVVISGLDVATIQQDELSGPQVSAMFWVNQTLGVAMALLTAACAPLLVWFYGVREVGPLTVALAGTSLAAAVGTQHLALLQRHMRLGSLGAGPIGQPDPRRRSRDRAPHGPAGAFSAGGSTLRGTADPCIACLAPRTVATELPPARYRRAAPDPLRRPLHDQQPDVLPDRQRRQGARRVLLGEAATGRCIARRST